MNARRQRTAGRVLLGLAVAASTACFMVGGPEDVAYEFWAAVQDGDRDAIESLTVESPRADLDFEDEDTRIESFEVGEARIDGETAEVETWVTGTSDDASMDLEFETVLVHRDGEWLVDLDRTTGRLVGAMLGVSMEELGEALGEGMSEAMEGMAEGMEELGRALQEAGEDMREESGGSN